MKWFCLGQHSESGKQESLFRGDFSSTSAGTGVGWSRDPQRKGTQTARTAVSQAPDEDGQREGGQMGKGLQMNKRLISKKGGEVPVGPASHSYYKILNVFLVFH